MRELKGKSKQRIALIENNRPTPLRHPREGGTTESGISGFGVHKSDSLLALRALWNDQRVKGAALRDL